MTTKATKKTTKKVARKKATKATTNKVKKNNNVVLTVAQARSIQNFLAKNNKNYKFLDTKISALV